jgi:hypothetical protein
MSSANRDNLTTFLFVSHLLVLLSLLLWLRTEVWVETMDIQWILLWHLHTQIQCIPVLFTVHHSFFLCCLPLVPSNSSTITNISWFLRKCFQFLPLQYNVGYKFVVWNLYDLNYPSIPTFLRALILKGC